MTNPNYTAIGVLLDRSGSMSEIKSDAEGGLRQFVDDQRKVDGKCTLRVCRFDNQYEVVYPSTNIAKAEYPVLQPRGSTALLDSWGRAMTEFGEELAALPEAERPGRVVFVVVTDGLENASTEWTREKVFENVTHQRERWGWEFIFLAANQDAVAAGRSFGVADTHAMTHAATGQGMQSAYAGLSSYVTGTRSGLRAAGEGFTEAERQQSEQK